MGPPPKPLRASAPPSGVAPSAESEVTEEDMEDVEDEKPLLLSVRVERSVSTGPPPPPSSRTATPRPTPAPSVAPITAKSSPSPAVPAAAAAAVSIAPPRPSSAAPSAKLASATSAPAAASATMKPREPWRMRDAARVSIVKSSTEPGLYYVRVLEDGKRPFEGFEGLLVALDPESTLRP